MTALVADIVGSTQMRSDLGEHAADRRFIRLLRLMSDTIEANGGMVIKTLGDGVLAAYGSASAAIVGAALLQRLASTEGVGLRVGLSTGDVRSDGNDIHGTPIVEATRLCAAATGGQILAAATVAVVARDRAEHKIVAIGSLELKGLADRLDVVAVQWEQASMPTTVPFPPPLRGSSPYVGRAAEVQAGLHAWQTASGGTGRLLAVSGELGIGKTRLAGRIAERASADGALVLYGRNDESVGAPYQPIVDALRPYVAACDDATLQARVGHVASELARLLPEIGERLGLAPSGDGDRWSLFGAVVELLTNAATDRGLVVVLDDLHWAEASTLLLARHAAQSAVPHLLVVMIWRTDAGADPAGLVDTMAELHRARVADHVRLSGLSESETSDLVASIGGAAPERDHLQRLYEDTAGNPFFVEEVLASGVRPGESPPSVREVLSRRIASISEPSRLALAGTAIAGLEFDVSAASAATGLPVDDVLDALDEGQAAGLVSSTPKGLYRFASALVRQELESVLSAGRRARVHWRLAEWMAERYGDQPGHAAEIAYHFSHGVSTGDPRIATLASQRAGLIAASQSAHEEAVVHFRDALGLIDRAAIDDPGLRYALLAGIGRESAIIADLAGASEAWTEALGIARKAADAGRFCEALRGARADIWVPYRDVELLAQIDEGLTLAALESNEQAILLAWRAGTETEAASAGHARKDLDIAVRTARRNGDPATLAAVLEHAIRALWGSPQVVERLQLAEECRAIVTTHQLAPPLAAEREIALCHLELGDRELADAGMQRVAKFADRTRSRFYRYAVAVYESACALMEGRFADSKRHARQARDIGGGSENLTVALAYGASVMNARLEEGRAEEIIEPITGIVSWSPDVSAWSASLAATYIEVGRTEEARDLLFQIAEPGLPSIPRDWFFPLAIGRLAEVCASLGDGASAAHILPFATEYRGHLLVVSMGAKVECAADRAIAQLLLAQGRLDEAKPLFVSAAALEDAVGARALAARTRFWHARVLEASGAPGAQQLLSQVLGETELIGMRRLHDAASLTLDRVMTGDGPR
jgi:tetratricopeptide (TPR) repeat protein